jgi:hypothetical protein
MSGFRRTSLFGLTLVSTLLLAAGCGYRSVLPGGSASAGTGRPSESDASIRSSSLAVMEIRNDSPEPWLDRILGDALRREVDLRARFDLVNDPERAELVLRGRIRPLSTLSNSFSSFVAALEYSVTMELDLEVVRASGLIVRLDSRTLSETEFYLASADVEITRTNRLEALRHLSDVLAARVVETLEFMEDPILPTAGSAGTPRPKSQPASAGEKGEAGE